MLGRTCCKCRASSFVNVVQSKLSKLMGLKLDGSVISLSFLGIKDIKVSLKVGVPSPKPSDIPSVELEQEYRYTLNNILPEIHHNPVISQFSLMRLPSLFRPQLSETLVSPHCQIVIWACQCCRRTFPAPFGQYCYTLLMYTVIYSIYKPTAT